MANNIFEFLNGLRIKPVSSSSSSREGEFELLSTDNKLRIFAGASNRAVVTEDQTQTLTNKTLSGSLNTFSNLPSSAFNIDSDINWNQFSITNFRRLEFFDPAAVIVGSNKLYVKSGNLFYNDGSGNQIQLTISGIVNASESITGLSPDDTVVFNDADNTLSFNADGGSDNMVLQASEYQAFSKYTFGIAGTPNLDFSSSQFNFNNGGTGNGNLKAGTYTGTASINVLDITGTAGGDAVQLIGRLTTSTTTDGLIIRSNTGAVSNRVATSGSDTNAGAAIRLVPDGVATNGGSIDYFAHSTSNSIDKNKHRFFIRTGVGTSTEAVRISSVGLTINPGAGGPRFSDDGFGRLVIETPSEPDGRVRLGPAGGVNISNSAGALEVTPGSGIIGIIVASGSVRLGSVFSGVSLSNSAGALEVAVLSGAVGLKVVGGVESQLDGSIRLGGSAAPTTFLVKHPSSTVPVVNVSDGASSSRSIVVGPLDSELFSSLRIIRGRISKTGTLLSGEGFTASQPGAINGLVRADFTTVFSATPTVVASVELVLENTGAHFSCTHTLSTGGVEFDIVDDTGSRDTTNVQALNFIAIGPR